jgi:hypothetical protein
MCISRIVNGWRDRWSNPAKATGTKICNSHYPVGKIGGVS